MKTDIVIGRIPVYECLRAHKRHAHRLTMLHGAKGLDEIEALARSAAIDIDSADRRRLDALSQGQVHQGVLLEADPLPLLRLDEWLDTSAGPEATVAVLDGVEDPQNAGAVIRSAAFFGAGAVVFAKDRAAPISPALVKAAAGGAEYIDLIRVTNLSRALDALKESGFWITGFDGEATTALWDIDLKGKTALVLGSEGKGMRRLVSEHCDHLAAIPVSGPIDSLNVSACAAVAFAECARQRRAR